MNGDPLFTVQSDQPDGPKSKVAIVTDGIAQVPVELAHQLGIYIVPFSLAVEGNIFTDLVDLDLNQLYQRMRLEKDLHLEISAPSVGKFYETFKACRDSGAESVLYEGISSHLSRAFTSAEKAAAMLHEEMGAWPVFMYDSRLVTAFEHVYGKKVPLREMPPRCAGARSEKIFWATSRITNTRRVLFLNYAPVSALRNGRLSPPRW